MKIPNHLKAAIKAANTTHKQWAQSQGITPKTVSELIKEGAIVVKEVVYRKFEEEAIVVDTAVYRKTKYRVPALEGEQS